MSQERLPPPPPACLGRLYPSTQKGGTLIAEDVTDRETHERRRSDPDGYRPVACPKCSHQGLHIHDYRERVLRGEAQRQVIVVVRYWCPGCTAIWQTVPLFLARCLWRSWPVVETATLGPPPSPSEPAVPERTVRRWLGRLAAAALLVTQVLATSGEPTLAAVASSVGFEGTRRELVLALTDAGQVRTGERLSSLAALLHRLAPGLRLT
jgi:hypothetical protein